MIFYKEGLLNAEGRALLPRASQESSMTMFIANAKKKRYHVRRCINAEEDLGPVGKNRVGMSHAVTAVGPFARTSRKKGKMALCQADQVLSHWYISVTGQQFSAYNKILPLVPQEQTKSPITQISFLQLIFCSRSGHFSGKTGSWPSASPENRSNFNNPSDAEVGLVGF